MDTTIEVWDIDPEWTVYAKCPVAGCKVVSHACCSDHVIEAVHAHMDAMHGTHYYRTA
jgi:protein gp37